MQGRAKNQRDLLDVDSVAGHLLASGSVFALLAEHRHELFPEALFADLFASGLGRPSVPADVVATVLVLQTLHGLSDREAADAVTFDLRWKAATGLPVSAASFHSSTLTYWRRRLAASSRPHRVFEVVAQVVAETGAIRGKTRRALDSTVLDDAVARQDTVTQLIACIRRVAREVPGGAELVAWHCTGHDYSRPGKPDIAWDDQAAREQLVSALVNDALTLLGLLDVDALEGKAAEAVALLALVAGQDVEPVPDSDGRDGRWRIARRVVPDRVISTVDPDARHAHKSRARRQDGFKAHVVIEPDTGLITATALTKAAGPGSTDAGVGVGLLARDTTIEQAATDAATRQEARDPLQVLGDTAYGTGPALAAFEAAGHTPVIKPWPLRPAVEGGFTLDDFTIDQAAGTVTCPAGATRAIALKGTANFGTACNGCPLRGRCTNAKDGRKITLHPQAGLLRAQRERAKDEDFQAIYRQHRPMVERSIAWLTRGNRKVPYRGVEKNNAWLHHRTAAINLRRLLVLGLHRTEGTWTLATT